MPSLEEYLQRADELAREVMNVWATQMNAGNASALTDEFKNLADRTDDYIKAKRIADNHRKFIALSEEEAAEELKTSRAFAETYKEFFEKHQGLGLAVASARAGHAVAIIDLDPQATAANWKDRRTEENPAVVSAQASRLRPTLEAAENSGVDFAFVDTAGRNDDSALSAARVADLVLIPTRPNFVEIETLGAVNDLLRLAGSPPSLVILNGIHPTAIRQADEAKAMLLRTFGLVAACPIHLCHRSAYAEAPTTGKAPQELDPEGKAATELDALFRFISEFVNMRRSEHVKDFSNSATA